MLRSDLCDYSNAYILVKGRVTDKGTANDNGKSLNFKNNALIRSYTIKINNTFINNAEDLDVFMPLYNLSEYSKNYLVTWGDLRNYYRDEVNDDANQNNPAGNYMINNNKANTSKSFEYKTKIIGEHQLIIID